jgi:sodium-dependent dicarboxylate transporter 2/3/5
VFGCVALLWMTREPIDVGALRVPLTGWGRLFGSAVGAGGKPEPFVRDSTVAMAGALALLLLPSRDGGRGRVLPWEHAVKNLPWGVLLLFGGGFALAEAFGPSGLNEYLQGLKGLPPLVVVLTVAFAMTALSEVASNTAAITMMLPVLKALADGLHTDPLPILLIGTLAASCGFMLPVATPANTIAYATGRVPVGVMGRAGFLLDVVATLVMALAVWWLGPLPFG